MSDIVQQQPIKLERMVLNILVDWISSQLTQTVPKVHLQDPTKAEDLLFRKKIIIHNYVQCKLPKMLQGKLFSGLKPKVKILSVITCPSMPDTVKDESIGLFDVMGNENISHVFINGLNWIKFIDSFFNKLYPLTGITCLTLNKVSPASLTYIVENCKLIETLNISNLSDLNDNNVDLLHKLKKLKTVNLWYTVVSEAGIRTLLFSCENLEYISTDIEKGNLKKISGMRMPDLTNDYYKNSYVTTMEQLKLVVTMCPLIQTLHVVKNCYMTGGCLKFFYNLQDISDLTLCYLHFYADQIQELLQARGHNLLSLQFIKVTRIDFSALRNIYLLCPNLLYLTFDSCEFVPDMRRIYPDNYEAFEEVFDPHLGHSEIKVPPLKYLKNLRLVGRNIRWSDNPNLISLLTKCPNV